MPVPTLSYSKGTTKESGNPIYLNHAGTSWPKPAEVHQAASEAFSTCASQWDDQFRIDHQRVAEHFGLSATSRLLLTPGCTSALSVAIADVNWQSGDRLLISGLEHHAVHRPGLKLVEAGVELEVVPPGPAGTFDLSFLEQSLKRGGAKMVAMSAAANVTGDLLPFEQAGNICREHQVLFLVDAAQIVGWFDLHLPELPIDIFAFGGHKGLQGPWGIGGLYVAPQVQMHSPRATCAIQPEEKSVQTENGAVPCDPMPGYCDVGSVDRIALHGLARAMDYLEAKPDRLAKAREQIARLQSALERLPGLAVVGNRDVQRRVPTVAVHFPNASSDSDRLKRLQQHLGEHHIIVASGHQCAPLAHQLLGTLETGLLRFSVGPSTKDQQILRVCEVIASFEC
jgi:selenocysteine lyase/cysteine desulfurase